MIDKYYINTTISNFVVKLKLFDKNGQFVVYAPSVNIDWEICDAFEQRMNYTGAFVGDLKELKKCKNIEQLCQKIAENTYDFDDYASDRLVDFGIDYVPGGEVEIDTDEAPEYLFESVGPDEYGDKILSMVEGYHLSKKAALESIKNFTSFENLAKIVCEREYMPEDEPDRIPENDEELCNLVETYNEAEDEAKNTVRNELLAYIHSTNTKRAGEYFGTDVERFIYRFDDEKLDQLVEQLLSGYGSEDVSGTEYYELDMQSGKITSYAEFNLDEGL